MSSPPTISQDKQAALQARLDALGVTEEELEERFVRGGGSGGQKVNKPVGAGYLSYSFQRRDGASNHGTAHPIAGKVMKMACF